MGHATIPYTQSYLPPNTAEAMADVVREGRLVMGHRVAQFEQSIAEFTGRAHAIAVTSGTSALELALRAHNIGPNFHVFVPAYTWVATYNVPLLLGARPVLVDVDPATFCMDPKALELARAQFPGPGHVAEMPRIRALFYSIAAMNWVERQGKGLPIFRSVR